VSDGSPAFERAADELERLSRMSRIETRGTLRIALKEAGLLPRGVNYRSMLVVLEKVLPLMLIRRGVQDAAEICKILATSMRERAKMEGSDGFGETPEKVFSRMGSTRPPSLPPPPSPPPSPSTWPRLSDTGRLAAVPSDPNRKPDGRK